MTSARLSARVAYSTQSLELQWLGGVEGAHLMSWHLMELTETFALGGLLQWVCGWRRSVGVVGVFQLLQVHLPVGLLDGFVHLRLAHNLSHEVLDGRFGVQLQELRDAAVLVVEGGLRRCDFVRALPTAAGECVAERPLWFRVDLIAVGELLVCSRVLWKQITVSDTQPPAH